MSQPALDIVACAGAAVAVMVDGRWAVAVAALAAAVGLLPAAADFGGVGEAAALLGVAAAASPAAWVARAASLRLPRPVRAGAGPARARSADTLFGPRAVRAAAALVVLPAASWVSFNIPVGSVIAVEGRLFPVAVVFAIGAVRLLLARTLSDLAAGVAVIAVGLGAAWLLRGGLDPLPAAVGVACLAPAAAAIAGWVGGRRRDPRAAGAAS